ncbi:MAG: glycosyltransferase [Metallibacterium scheffleri]|jgi:glycosyltransferase involved in cell wall biosynthesis
MSLPDSTAIRYDAKPAQKRLTVAYVLAYRAPDFIRSRSLLIALEACDGIKLTVARNHSTGMARYFETWRALRQLRKSFAPDLYVLGFRGHEMYWPVRWLTHGKPLVFDALMSPSAALREENKTGLIGQLIAPLLRWLEIGILHDADLVLTDTEQHIDFYVDRYDLPRKKLLAVPVGAMEGGTTPDQQDQHSVQSAFSVLFYGSMLPLHGVDVIVAAAAQLQDLPIRFDFIGGGAKQSRRLRQLCERHGVTRYTHRAWVPLNELVDTEIPRADLCLGGPFGGTPQGRRVITSKTSQALALGKATVIGAIDEDIGWIDKDNCLLVPQADPDALVAALRWAFAERNALSRIGARGHALYRQKLSIHAIAQRLCPALRELHDRYRTGR